MIKGTGIDILEIPRMVKLLEKGAVFKDKVFSKMECDYCEKQGVPSQSYAGKFAAKEAFLKAIGTGWRGEIQLCEIEIENNDLGMPHLRLIGKTKKILSRFESCVFHVSISHTAQYAVAMVIVEDGNTTLQQGS